MSAEKSEPVHLNTATKEQLIASKLFSSKDVDSLLQQRGVEGQLSLERLKASTSLTEERLEKFVAEQWVTVNLGDHVLGAGLHDEDFSHEYEREILRVALDESQQVMKDTHQAQVNLTKRLSDQEAMMNRLMATSKVHDIWFQKYDQKMLSLSSKLDELSRILSKPDQKPVSSKSDSKSRVLEEKSVGEASASLSQMTASAGNLLDWSMDPPLYSILNVTPACEDSGNMYRRSAQQDTDSDEAESENELAQAHVTFRKRGRTPRGIKREREAARDLSSGNFTSFSGMQRASTGPRMEEHGGRTASAGALPRQDDRSSPMLFPRSLELSLGNTVNRSKDQRQQGAGHTKYSGPYKGSRYGEPDERNRDHSVSPSRRSRGDRHGHKSTRSGSRSPDYSRERRRSRYDRSPSERHERERRSCSRGLSSTDWSSSDD